MRSPPDWWKKWKPLRWLAGLGLLTGLGAAVAPYFISTELEASPQAHPEAHYTAMKGDPVALLDGFRSYDSIEKTGDALTAAGYTPETLRNHKPRSRKYPPRDLDSLTITNYKHLGVTGRMELVFFNGALYQAVFDVSQPDSYAPALTAAEPLIKRDRLGTAELRDGNRRVLTNVYFSANPVGHAAGSRGWVMWQDLELVKLINQWEVEYGLILP